MPRIAFSIHYSVARGYEQAALGLARRLFAVYDTGIDALMLIPAEDEDFTLYFNGQAIASLQRDGREPMVADVRALFSREGITVVRRPGPEEGADDDEPDAE
jgi:hypothetical protein